MVTPVLIFIATAYHEEYGYVVLIVFLAGLALWAVFGDGRKWKR